MFWSIDRATPVVLFVAIDIGASTLCCSCVVMISLDYN